MNGAIALGAESRSHKDLSGHAKTRKPKADRSALQNSTPPLGKALRSIYDTTLDEPIPPEMLDLLKKLG